MATTKGRVIRERIASVRQDLSPNLCCMALMTCPECDKDVSSDAWSVSK